MVQYFSLAEVRADLYQTCWKLKTMGFQVPPVIQQRILSLWMPADCHPMCTTCQLMYQETCIMAGLDGLPVFVVSCCCMLLTKFKREELMTQGIRMLSKLEWTCGIVLASDQGFAAQSL